MHPDADGHGLPRAAPVLFEVEGLGLPPKTEWAMQGMGLVPSLHPKYQLWKPTLSCSAPADVLKVQRPWSLLTDLLSTNPAEQFWGVQERTNNLRRVVQYHIVIFSFRVVSLNGAYEGFLRNCFEHWKL